MSVVTAEAIQDLAASGVVRAAINIADPVLACKAPAGGEPSGVSVDIAPEIGRRLDRPVQLIVYETAGKVVEALARSEWDVAFLADEPARADRVVFSAPYVVIEGTYRLARRRLRQRQRARSGRHPRRGWPERGSRPAPHPRAERRRDRPRPPTFAATKADVRVLPDAFMASRQTVASPPGRNADSAYLHTLIQDLKASGWIRAALDRNGEHGVAVAA
jgi:polar amino acid transport system substrate-binding protein